MSPIRRRLIITLATLLLVAMVPVAVMAAGGTFTDDDTSIFEADIEWMAANGITSGCGTGLYCPDDNVTRGQMAAFMKRLATKKVVAAATADTAGHATTADSATTAGTATHADKADLATNSNQLGGKGSTSYQPALFDFEGDQDLLINGFGTYVIATGEVTAGTGFFCLFPQSPQADILVRASGYTSGVGAGETASLYLAVDGVEIDGTRRVVAADDGVFTTEWLYSSGGGEETFTLEALEAVDVYNVVNAQITVEVLQDTRCEGGPIIIFPGNPNAAESDPQF